MGLHPLFPSPFPSRRGLPRVRLHCPSVKFAGAGQRGSSGSPHAEGGCLEACVWVGSPPSHITLCVWVGLRPFSELQLSPLSTPVLHPAPVWAAAKVAGATRGCSGLPPRRGAGLWGLLGALCGIGAAAGTPPPPLPNPTSAQAALGAEGGNEAAGPLSEARRCRWAPLEETRAGRGERSGRHLLRVSPAAAGPGRGFVRPGREVKTRGGEKVYLCVYIYLSI